MKVLSLTEKRTWLQKMQNLVVKVKGKNFHIGPRFADSHFYPQPEKLMQIRRVVRVAILWELKSIWVECDHSSFCALTYEGALLAVTGLDPLDGELRHLEVAAELDGTLSVPLQQQLPGRL